METWFKIFISSTFVKTFFRENWFKILLKSAHDFLNTLFLTTFKIFLSLSNFLIYLQALFQFFFKFIKIFQFFLSYSKLCTIFSKFLEVVPKSSIFFKKITEFFKNLSHNFFKMPSNFSQNEKKTANFFSSLLKFVLNLYFSECVNKISSKIYEKSSKIDQYFFRFQIALEVMFLLFAITLKIF